MKYSALFLALGLSIGLSLPADAAGKKIRKAADFQSHVVGKTLVYGNGMTIRVGDGTLSGKTGKGVSLKGAWNWQKKYFCRSVQVGTKKLPDDCQTVELDGDQITFTRNKGKGDKSTATLN